MEQIDSEKYQINALIKEEKKIRNEVLGHLYNQLAINRKGEMSKMFKFETVGNQTHVDLIHANQSEQDLDTLETDEDVLDYGFYIKDKDRLFK